MKHTSVEWFWETTCIIKNTELTIQVASLLAVSTCNIFEMKNYNEKGVSISRKDWGEKGSAIFITITIIGIIKNTKLLPQRFRDWDNPSSPHLEFPWWLLSGSRGTRRWGVLCLWTGLLQLCFQTVSKREKMNEFKKRTLTF